MRASSYGWGRPGKDGVLSLPDGSVRSLLRVSLPRNLVESGSSSSTAVLLGTQLLDERGDLTQTQPRGRFTERPWNGNLIREARETFHSRSGHALWMRAQRKVTAASGLGPAPSQGTNYCLTLTKQFHYLWSKGLEKPFWCFANGRQVTRMDLILVAERLNLFLPACS